LCAHCSLHLPFGLLAYTVCFRICNSSDCFSPSWTCLPADRGFPAMMCRPCPLSCLQKTPWLNDIYGFHALSSTASDTGPCLLSPCYPPLSSQCRFVLCFFDLSHASCSFLARDKLIAAGSSPKAQTVTRRLHQSLNVPDLLCPPPATCGLLQWGERPSYYWAYGEAGRLGVFEHRVDRVPPSMDANRDGRQAGTVGYHWHGSTARLPSRLW
jgi:hypothetical protein